MSEAAVEQPGDPAFPLPTRVQNLINKAVAAGFRSMLTYADQNGVRSVVIRFWNDSGLRAYGLWTYVVKDDGKPSVAWGWGGEPSLFVHIKTLASLEKYLFSKPNPATLA